VVWLPESFFVGIVLERVEALKVVEQGSNDNLVELMRKWKRVLVNENRDAVVLLEDSLNFLSLSVRLWENAWMTHPYSFTQLTIVALEIEQSANNDGLALGLLPLAVFFVKLDGQFYRNYDYFVVSSDLHLG
jgi:hypothetical protein